MCGIRLCFSRISSWFRSVSALLLLNSSEITQNRNTNKLYLGLIIKLHSENIVIYILYIYIKRERITIYANPITTKTQQYERL